MKEGIALTGMLRLIVYNTKLCKVIEDWTGKNLIVNQGKTNMARLLGGDPLGAKITKIAVGENQTPPDVSDMALTNQFTKNVDSVTFPSGNSAQFVFSLGSGDANGMNISELGLFTEQSTLFSRKTRTPIVKNSNVIITGIWTITVN